MEILNNWVKRHENWLVPICLALMLCISYLLYPVSGGENQYLAMAKQFMNPNWIPESFTLTEFPGSRVLFQYVFGWPLKFMEIETAAVIYRALNFLFLAFPLYKILKYIGLNSIMILLCVQVFITGQAQLGGEWIIGTFEPKTVAYVFFMWAFWFWLTHKNYKMVLFGALACYFHIIVGGWFFIAVGLISLFQNTWKSLIKPAAFALVLLIPFVIYLAPLLFGSDAPESNPTTDYIYAYYRLNNHLGIALNWKLFTDHHLKGAIITLVLFTGSFALQSKIPRPIRSWIRVGFGISLFYVGIAFVDSFLLDKQAAFGLKYYPFRLNSFAYLLVLTALLLWLQNKTVSKWNIVKWLLILLAIGLSVGKGVDSYKRYQKNDKKFHHELNAWIKANSTSKDVFLLAIKDTNGPYYQNFNRLTERENYSVYKFVPAEKTKIIEWYRRQGVLKTQLISDTLLQKTLQSEGVNYVVSESPFSDVKPEFTSGKLKVYRVSED